MPKGFRDFILRGNVVDLAVAFVLGGAFATVVTSFVGDILTPLLGLIGVPDFSTLVWTTPGGAEVQYGVFLNALIAFVLVAAAIYFFVVKPMERLQRPAEATTKTCPDCGSEIPLAARRCPMCTSQLAGERTTNISEEIP
ncbi:MAG: large conductance mechanosensitive channel protein MscL [Chloroflexota bacterium]|nr:large conductance mechanosensitive channel protein MscL [Chloroflexota bacterium]